MIDEIQPRKTLDERPSSRRIGLIALATDHTVEADFRRLVASDAVAVHVTRVAYANPTTPENLRAMQPLLTEAAALSAGKPRTPVITPAGAAARALHALSAKSIAILTPYVPRTAEPMHAFFSRQGFWVDRLVCLGMEDDRDMARLPHDEIVRLAIATITPQTKALFIACTALRAAQCVPEIERQTGLPVVTSNLAAAWASLRQCGIPADPKSPCSLLTLTETSYPGHRMRSS